MSDSRSLSLTALLAGALALGSCDKKPLAPSSVELAIGAHAANCNQKFEATPDNFGADDDSAFPEIARVKFTKTGASMDEKFFLASYDHLGAGQKRMDVEQAIFGERQVFFLELKTACGVLNQIDAGCGDAPPDAGGFNGDNFNKGWIRQGPPCNGAAGKPPTGGPTSPSCPAIGLNVQSGEARPNPDGQTAQGPVKVWWTNVAGAPQQVTVMFMPVAIYGTRLAGNGQTVTRNFEMKPEPYDVRVEVTDGNCNSAHSFIRVPAKPREGA